MKSVFAGEWYGYLTLLLIATTIVCGCENTQPMRLPNNGINASVKGGGDFPEFLVGVWEAKLRGKVVWGMKFERDGSISKIVHGVAGPVKLADGGIFEEGPDKGTFCLFEMGPCEAEYEPKKRMLRVKIFVDHYHMKFPNGDLTGRSEDYFEGAVLKDGKTWNVEWRCYSWLKGAAEPDKKIIEANPEKLIFTKIL